MDADHELTGGLEQEMQKLNRVYDPVTKRVLPFHTYYDAADGQELDAAIAAGNAMVVHFEFGSTIKTDPDVPRVCRLALPRLCLVSFAKRAICRQICPGMYPSFIRLSWPDTGEVLEDKDAGAPARAETQASCQRTLASYDVGHQSVLQLDIVEGNTFEAIDYRDLATVGTTTPTAAVAATEKRESPTGRGRQLVAQRALRVIGANAQQTRNAPRHQTAQARRAWTREEELQGNDPSCWRLKELQGNLCALVASQVVLFNGRCLEPGMQTVALLKGMKKYNGTAWKAILDDPEFAETLSRRTGVNLKDRWVNLEKAADRNFQNMKMKVAEDAELHDLVQQILAGLGKI